MSTDVATATKPTVTGLERAGTGVMVVSLLALVLYLVYPGLAPTLKSSGDISNAMTILVASVAAAAVLGLIGAALGAPALFRGPSLGRGVSTGASVLVLIVAAAASLVSVLPHVQSLQNLQNTIEPYGFAIRDNCGTPLSNTTTQYKQIATDANNSQLNPQAFGPAMVKDLPMLQADEPIVNAAIVKLQAYAAPAKYQDLENRCILDAQGTIGFLTDPGTVPIAPNLSQIEGVVDLNTSIPAALKPAVKDTIAQNLPAGVSAEGLLKLAIALANNTYTVNPPTGYPAAVGAQAAPVAQQLILGILPTFVSTVFTTAANSTDAPLTADGNQLQNDIVAELKKDLPGFKLDTVALTS